MKIKGAIGKISGEIMVVPRGLKSGEGGTMPTEENAGLKQDIIGTARRKIRRADSSKYGIDSLFSVTPLLGFDDVISDDKLPVNVQGTLVAEPFSLSLAKQQ